MRIASAILSGTSIVLGAWLISAIGMPQNNQRIRVTPNEADRRVDISIDGQPFTSYIWPTNLAKPVLYPLRTAKGTEVTRGFPLNPKPGERVRPVADQKLDGHWTVRLSRYSPQTDPALKGRAKGTG